MPDEILGRASRLTLDELAALAAHTNRLAGRLGTRRRWTDAMNAARRAAGEAGRSAILAERANAATDAIFSALTANAGSADKAAQLHHSLEDYQRAIDAGAERPRRRRFRQVQRQLIRTVGFRTRRHVGPAVIGTTAAVTAAVVWDLASGAGPFDARERDLLIHPWRQAIG
jgi:hypothetical protein